MNRLLFMAEVFCCTLLGYGAAQGLIYVLGEDTGALLHHVAAHAPSPPTGGPSGAVCTPDLAPPAPPGVHSPAEAGIKRGSGGSARRPRLPVTP